MPLHASVVGASTEPVDHAVDARWIMAYAAGIGDSNPRYLDTQAHTVVAHPAFPVCLEWPAILASRGLPGYASMTPEEAARGVHAAHDLHIYRPIRAGDRLSTAATVIDVKPIKPGAALTLRLDTTDRVTGELVCRTYQLGISRGVEVIGNAESLELPPALPTRDAPAAPSHRWELPVRAGAAHVYTECARIWNPIHTDRAVALAAGLPDLILHGTATMAMAVSRLVDEYLDGDCTRARRLGGRFTAMVLMPSTLVVEVVAEQNGAVLFEVRTGDGRPAFSDGFFCYA